MELTLKEKHTRGFILFLLFPVIFLVALSLFFLSWFCYDTRFQFTKCPHLPYYLPLRLSIVPGILLPFVWVSSQFALFVSRFKPKTCARSVFHVLDLSVIFCLFLSCVIVSSIPREPCFFFFLILTPSVFKRIILDESLFTKMHERVQPDNKWVSKA